MSDTDMARPLDRALVSDPAPSGQPPAGFNPSRIEALESIIRDTIWMACRYAHGRQSYAVGMYNDAARRAVELGVIEQGLETFVIDGSMSAGMSGLTQQEFAAAWHCWSSPQAIRTHIPYRDSDGSPEGGDAGGSVHDSAGLQASPTISDTQGDA